jgi:hypothetical protein
MVPVSATGDMCARDNLPDWAASIIAVAVGLSPGLALLSARPSTGKSIAPWGPALRGRISWGRNARATKRPLQSRQCEAASVRFELHFARQRAKKDYVESPVAIELPQHSTRPTTFLDVSEFFQCPAQLRRIEEAPLK